MGAGAAFTSWVAAASSFSVVTFLLLALVGGGRAGGGREGILNSPGTSIIQKSDFVFSSVNQGSNVSGFRQEWNVRSKS